MKLDKAMEGIGLALSAIAVLFAMMFSVTANQGHERIEDHAVKASASADVFEQFRMERKQVRELETVQLTALMNDLSVKEDVRIEAAGMLNEIAERMEMETTIEGILMMRGHEEVVVTVHPGSVNVVLKEGTNNRDECAFILDLVLRETGQTAGNVKIIGVSES
ncbi:MAG: SpoIIIAH-like family protein [Clostridia bacterium]|nr:SpoIIIAH-like family protein [Clostridia bacterium]